MKTPPPAWGRGTTPLKHQTAPLILGSMQPSMQEFQTEYRKDYSHVDEDQGVLCICC